MFHVFNCVVDRHDLRLVSLAGLLCVFSCISALIMLRRARAASGWTRLLWLASAGIVAGCGIWATHFVAMLAFVSGFSVGYDWSLTVFSALIAISMSACGFAVALGRNGAVPGGALVGAAVGTMHYVGMAALRASADPIWDWRYVVVSVAIGIVLSALAVWFSLRRDLFRFYGGGALLLALAICVMHFTGMAAVEFRYDPLIPAPRDVMEPVTLAVFVASIAALIVAMGLAGALVDGRLAVQRKYIGELEAAKTSLERTSEKLSLALAAAAAASRAKSSFLAAMGHELKTPLNAVIGFAEMLTMEPFGPLGSARYKEYVKDIRDSGVRLLAIVSDVLDISRFDSGESGLKPEETDLREIIAAALEVVAPQAESSGVALSSVLDPGLPNGLVDRARMGQALTNLLDNAVKFTPRGGQVGLRAFARDGGIVIAIADSGIGIAAEDIPRALERFGQVDARLARKYEGVGLGLPLARQIVELHGGALTLDSRLEVGTTVTIMLPASRTITRPEQLAAAA